MRCCHSCCGLQLTPFKGYWGRDVWTVNSSTTRNYGLPEPSGNTNNYKAAANNVRRRKIGLNYSAQVKGADGITFDWSCTVYNSMCRINDILIDLKCDSIYNVVCHENSDSPPVTSFNHLHNLFSFQYRRR